jgi:anti-sigma factor RsiW
MKLERLSCRKRVELLCAYLDKELPSSQSRVIAAHRRSCRPCSELLASLTRTIRTLNRLKSRAKAPASVRRVLAAALTRAPGP